MSASPVNELDERRRDLSFRDEVALLACSRLTDRGLNVDDARRQLADRVPTSPAGRAALCEALLEDLVRAPVPVDRHEEWRSAELGRLPGPLRGARPEVPAGPLAASRRPHVSARHQRLETLEPGRLALLPAPVRQKVERRLTRHALGQLLRALGQRERLALLNALGEPDTALLTALERERDTLQLVAVESFRAGFARAAAGASDPGHLLERFATFVLAAALGARHEVEARALAEVREYRAGRRLLRYHRRAVRHPEVLRQESRRLLDAALARTLARTLEDDE